MKQTNLTEQEKGKLTGPAVGIHIQRQLEDKILYWRYKRPYVVSSSSFEQFVGCVWRLFQTNKLYLYRGTCIGIYLPQGPTCTD